MFGSDPFRIPLSQPYEDSATPSNTMLANIRPNVPHLFFAQCNDLEGVPAIGALSIISRNKH